MASDPEPSGPTQMQRVRVGMIGLAFVFLLVMLATALLSIGRSGDLAAGNGAASLAAAANAADDPPREPLAELGVAPGNPPETVASARPAKR